MKSGKRLYKIVWTLVVLSVLSGLAALLSATPARAEYTQPDEALDRSAVPYILDATVQIYLYPPTKKLGVSVFERGLGTLVRSGEEFLVLTHDHWNFLDNAEVVMFVSARGEPLLKISGDEFRSRIRYRDRGNLLLDAPVEIWPDNEYLRETLPEADPYGVPADASIADVPAEVVGRVVLIAHRHKANSELVEVIAGRIEAQSERDGTPIYRLRSLDGTVIVPGDSGGGIWLDGQLVGNLWLTEWTYDWRFWTWESLHPATRYLDTSIAAALPVWSH